jgi:hypothetical protein
VTNELASSVTEKLCPVSTVVENSTHNPKIGGSNPAIGTGREKVSGEKCDSDEGRGAK